MPGLSERENPVVTSKHFVEHTKFDAIGYLNGSIDRDFGVIGYGERNRSRRNHKGSHPSGGRKQRAGQLDADRQRDTLQRVHR